MLCLVGNALNFSKLKIQFNQGTGLGNVVPELVTVSLIRQNVLHPR